MGGSLTGAILTEDSAAYFAQATGSFGSLPWHLAVVLITVIILVTGSVTQIERANRVMMPVFFVLFTVLAVRVFFLPGASDGYNFLFVPKWERLLDVNTWVMAMGQAFFSLSITGSGMIVYGSYLNKKADIVGSSMRTALFDTVAALLSALAIMPAVFAFGIEPAAGPSLMFITIPKIFGQMPMGQIFAVIFFLSVVFAGITSLINMFEAVIESIQHRFEVPRKLAVLLCGIICFVVGVFLEAEPSVGKWMDFITTSWFLLERYWERFPFIMCLVTKKYERNWSRAERNQCLPCLGKLPAESTYRLQLSCLFWVLFIRGSDNK